MTERQEHIVREIGLELTRAKAKCKEQRANTAGLYLLVRV